jgi:hypothetical protein
VAPFVAVCRSTCTIPRSTSLSPPTRRTPNR